MSTSVQPYNITLNQQSPTFQYSPFRNGDITKGWNETFTGGPVYSPGTGTATPTIRATQYNGAQMTFTFEGTALYLCYTNNGSATSLTVDGAPVTTTAPISDNACSLYHGLAQTLAVADGLAYMQHTAVLDVTISDAEGIFWFFGGVVSISIGELGSTVSDTQWIDDRDPLWVWSPSPWFQGGYYLDYNNTVTYYCTYSSFIRGTYTVPPGASAIQLLGMPLPNTYTYTISLDNVETTYNSESSLTIGQQVLFFAGGLDPTVVHTISAINFDASVPNPPAGVPGTCFPNLDALVVTKVSPPTAPPLSSSSTSRPASPSSTTASSTSLPASPSSTTASSSGSTAVGAIAGGVVGGLVAVMILSLLIFLFLCRRGSRGRSLLPTPGAALDEDQEVVQSTLHQTLPQTEPSSLLSNPGPSPTDLLGRLKSPRLRVAPSATPASISRIDRSPPNLEHISTVQMVEVLNSRLRLEQADNVEEPPAY